MKKLKLLHPFKPLVKIWAHKIYKEYANSIGIHFLDLSDKGKVEALKHAYLNEIEIPSRISDKLISDLEFEAYQRGGNVYTLMENRVSQPENREILQKAYTDGNAGNDLDSKIGFIYRELNRLANCPAPNEDIHFSLSKDESKKHFLLSLELTYLHRLIHK